MSTTISVTIEAFLKRVEKDRDFFNYINLSDADSMELALRRAGNYLNEAVSKLSIAGCNHIDLTDIDETLAVFNEDLTRNEIFLIASMMYEFHLDRDISKLKTLSVNFTSTDLRVFDPSNARSTFIEMFKAVRDENKSLIDDYKNTDRETGKFLGIDYAQYDD